MGPAAFHSGEKEGLEQGRHRHMLEQRARARKHSQYFLRQREFLQLQPLMCSPRANALWTDPASPS